MGSRMLNYSSQVYTAYRTKGDIQARAAEPYVLLDVLQVKRYCKEYSRGRRCTGCVGACVGCRVSHCAAACCTCFSCLRSSTAHWPRVV